MVKADIQRRLAHALERAFQLLRVDVSKLVINSLSSLILRCMTAEGRYYHTPEHALSLTDENDPIQLLAALFHDIVYFQIDQGFHAEVFEIIYPYLRACGEKNEGWCLAEEVSANDYGYHQVKEIFGLKDGQQLYTTGGSNEFLSSLVMAKKLESILPRRVILEVSCSIEATIPFRKNASFDSSAFAILADRLRKVSSTYNIPMSEEEIDQAIQGAVRFANLDVQNFSDPNPAHFLQNTWSLLPEFNPALRKGVRYSIGDYRKALGSMATFLSSIRPEDVLHGYKDVPPVSEIKEKLVIIRQNLLLGREYLELKLLACAVLEALALASGGDVAMSEFIGDVTSEKGDQGLDQLLQIPSPESTPEKPTPVNSLLSLLQSGIPGVVDFADVRTSALATYIYQSISPGKLKENINAARQMFEGKINAEEFLCVIEAGVLSRVVEAIACLAPERRKKLQSLIAEEIH